jgi:hypothetical protein
MLPSNTFSSVLHTVPTSSLSLEAAQLLTESNTIKASPESGRREDDSASARASSLDNTVETVTKKGSTGRKRHAKEIEWSEKQSEIGAAKCKKREYNHESFPVKLHRLLRETKAQGKQDIISFSGDGTLVSVYKPSSFEKEILPKYFRHNKLSSFRRLLNMYGFERLRDGVEGGTFRHPSFLKNRPDLCTTIERVR